MKFQNRFILPAIAWFIMTTVLLVLPAPALPKKGWIINIPLFDKWIHIGLFSMLTVLCCWGFYKRKKSAAKWSYYFTRIAIAVLVYGIAMEFVQKYFVPDRSFDEYDILSDGIGAALGCLFSVKVYKKNRPL